MSTNRVNNDFSAITFGRKSVRVYDETVKISHEEMLTMIQEATTAPHLLTCNHGVSLLLKVLSKSKTKTTDPLQHTPKRHIGSHDLDFW